MKKRGLSDLSTSRRAASWPEILLVVALVAIILAAPSAWIYGASVEATTFNRFTDGDATTWEAMWTNFRVDCN